MPAITLKNIPDDLYAKIKKNAEINFRSINSEILFRLKSSVIKNEPDINYLLRRIQTMQSKVKMSELNDELILISKNKGRK